MTTLLDCSDEIWVELEDIEQDQLWQHIQDEYYRSTDCWHAYLNQLCLCGIVPWLQEHDVFGQQVYDTFEMNGVPGVAVRLEAAQFILIPSEAIDQGELRVPQEWVDISGWAGDYYLAVQVNPDEGWVKVWGYSTHLNLKQQGQYDQSDRTYSLDGDGLTTNMAILLVTQELCPNQLTRGEPRRLASLRSAQVDALIQRLARPTVLVPRLEIPFEMWGALLADAEWRSRLSQALKTASPSTSVHVGTFADTPLLFLKQWFNPLFSETWIERGWQPLDTLIPSNVAWAMAFRGATTATASNTAVSDTAVSDTAVSDTAVSDTAVSDTAVSDTAASDISMGKRLVFTLEDNAVPLLLLVRAATQADGRLMIQTQLRPESNAGQMLGTLPEGVELALLAPTEAVVQSVQGRSLDAFIQLKRFRLSDNTPFSLRIQLGDETMTERFTT